MDNILGICTHYQENGKILPLDDNQKKIFLAAMAEMSDKALRTLGLAYRDSNEKLESNELEKNLIFVGIVGMIDPPRMEVKDSIRIAREAGITPIMITGDFPNTAFAIAHELGIADEISEAITGQEIDNMSEKDFVKNIRKYKIFARVSPEHKVRIVRALKSHGNIVSMTGD